MAYEDFKEYLRCRNRLRELEAAGRGDSPEADRVREEGNGPWQRMSDLERDCFRREESP
jgi:hypothetical protein